MPSIVLFYIVGAWAESLSKRTRNLGIIGSHVFVHVSICHNFTANFNDTKVLSCNLWAKNSFFTFITSTNWNSGRSVLFVVGYMTHTNLSGQRHDVHITVVCAKPADWLVYDVRSEWQRLTNGDMTPDQLHHIQAIIWGYRGGSHTAVRPSDPALCGSRPLLTPY